MKINRANGSLMLILSVAAALALLQGQAFGQTTYSWTGSSGRFQQWAELEQWRSPPSNGSTRPFWTSARGARFPTRPPTTFPGASASLPLGGFNFNGSSTGNVTIFTGSNNFQLGAVELRHRAEWQHARHVHQYDGRHCGGFVDLQCQQRLHHRRQRHGNRHDWGEPRTNVVMTGSGNITVNFTTPGTSLNPESIAGQHRRYPPLESMLSPAISIYLPAT